MGPGTRFKPFVHVSHYTLLFHMKYIFLDIFALFQQHKRVKYTNFVCHPTENGAELMQNLAKVQSYRRSMF